MDAAIPADAQNAPTGIWKSRTEREIPTAPTPIIVVVNERKNNGDSNSVAKPSTESDQAHSVSLPSTRPTRRPASAPASAPLARAGAVSRDDGALAPRLIQAAQVRPPPRASGRLRSGGSVTGQ